MEFQQKEDHFIVNDVKDFNIEQILECGQCFHFEKVANMDYILVAMNRLLHIRQEKNEVIFFNTSEEEYNHIWKSYFDMDQDYEHIKSRILSKDNTLQSAIESKEGIRILKQDFFETLISFIISQNKQIPHIKKIVFDLSEIYGDFLGEINGKKYYHFPNVNQLENVSEEEFRACKTGFRAPYIMDAVKKVSTGAISYEELQKMSTTDASKYLQQIKGVGEKVANCVLLFGCGRTESFPVDVWMKRIMEHLYIGKEVSKEKILMIAKERFGEYGGYAQQYLFSYGRENQIGK